MENTTIEEIPSFCVITVSIFFYHNIICLSDGSNTIIIADERKVFLRYN